MCIAHLACVCVCEDDMIFELLLPLHAAAAVVVVGGGHRMCVFVWTMCAFYDGGAKTHILINYPSAGLFETVIRIYKQNASPSKHRKSNNKMRHSTNQ